MIAWPIYSAQCIYIYEFNCIGIGGWKYSKFYPSNCIILKGILTNYTLRNKVLPSTFFWCISLSQIGDSCQYLEGPNVTWKNHNRNIFCPGGPQYSCCGPSRYHLVLQGTGTSTPSVTSWSTIKWCLEVLFFLECGSSLTEPS